MVLLNNPKWKYRASLLATKVKERIRYPYLLFVPCSGVAQEGTVKFDTKAGHRFEIRFEHAGTWWMETDQYYLALAGPEGISPLSRACALPVLEDHVLVFYDTCWKPASVIAASVASPTGSTTLELDDGKLEVANSKLAAFHPSLKGTLQGSVKQWSQILAFPSVYEFGEEFRALFTKHDLWYLTLRAGAAVRPAPRLGSGFSR